jgi:protein TonB
MANSVLLPPENPEGGLGKAAPTLRPLDAVKLSGDLGEAEQGVFQSLVSSIRDVFFPVKLPPLVLESQPIAVVDRMKVKRDPTSTAIAVGIHIVAFLVIGYLIGRSTGIIKPVEKPVEISLAEPPRPPKIPPKAVLAGGGGGQKGPTPVTKGNPPKFSPQTPLNPPKVPPLEQPKIQIQSTVDVQKDIKMAHVDTPNFGLPNAPAVGMSMGNGNGAGLGSGKGNGIGPGTGGNIGGGLRRIGGGVSAPEVLFQPEPEFSEEARKAKVAGNVLVYLIVDTNGNPKNVHVIRGIGMGLDEKAMDAVRKYKFRPAMENGKAVPVEMQIEVNFQIF